MIGILDITIQAHSPNFPLSPIYTFTNSAQSFRLRGVPKQIGDWKIESVAIALTYPDNTTVHADCVREGNIWIGTVAGCPTSGSSTNGFVVTASGTDENGNPVTNYTLGAGDIYVMEIDGSVSPTDDGTRMFYYGSVPTTPKKGDVCFFNDELKIYDGTNWKQTADLSSYLPFDKWQSEPEQGFATFPYMLTIHKPFNTPELYENPTVLVAVGNNGNVENVVELCDDTKNEMMFGFDSNGTPQTKWGYDDYFGKVLKWPDEGGTIATREWVLQQLANLKAELQS